MRVYNSINLSNPGICILPNNLKYNVFTAFFAEYFEFIRSTVVSSYKRCYENISLVLACVCLQVVQSRLVSQDKLSLQVSHNSFLFVYVTTLYYHLLFLFLQYLMGVSVLLMLGSHRLFIAYYQAVVWVVQIIQQGIQSIILFFVIVKKIIPLLFVLLLCCLKSRLEPFYRYGWWSINKFLKIDSFKEYMSLQMIKVIFWTR